jgi:enolase-phosphatase E1
MTYRAYLLDIEGTTTPVDFVYKTLFPFARRELPEFLRRSALGAMAETLQTDAQLLAEEYAADLAAGQSPPTWDDRPQPGGLLPYLLWLMDHDRKSRGLKSIQGRIWEDGYGSGDLQGEIYPDVEPALHRWRERGARIYIYSSGSVLAQKLLFGHLPVGDLTPLLAGHFDTEVGSKRESASYASIAAQIGIPAAEILFLSDTPQELTAAHGAGMAALHVVRDPAVETAGPTVRTFAEVR